MQTLSITRTSSIQVLRLNKLRTSRRLLLILMSLTLTASIVTHTANAVEPTATPEFVISFGVGAADGSSTAPGMLSHPADVAVDSSGNAYVADAANSRIKKFTNTGTYITQWGGLGNGNGQLNYPWSLAIDASNNVYVADANNHRIQKFSSTGTYLTQWGSFGGGNGQFWSPEVISIDQSGNVYVTDAGNGRVQKFTNTGTYITQWGSFGSGDGQFSYPTGIASDSSGNIYVTDESQDRVQKFSNTGSYLAQWGGSGTGNGQLDGPSAVAIDSADNVYIIDSYNNRIQKFTTSGTYLSQWGNNGSGNGQFEYSLGIAIDSAGDVFVADTYNHRMQKFGYPKTAELEVPNSSQDIELTTPAATSITSSTVVTEASLVKQDPANTFPLGLVDFELTAAAGSTQQINLAFVTDLSPGDVTARKYHSVNNTYGDVPGATITETTVDGKHALLLTYDVTDGGPLDDDNLANGVIVDPVGLAVGSNLAAPGAPNSGIGMALSLPILTTIIVLPVLTYIVYRRRSYR